MRKARCESVAAGQRRRRAALTLQGMQCCIILYDHATCKEQALGAAGCASQARRIQHGDGEEDNNKPRSKLGQCGRSVQGAGQAGPGRGYRRAQRRGAGVPHSLLCMPPATTSVSPVMYAASSDARKATAAAMSPGVPSRPSSVRLLFSSSSSGLATSAAANCGPAAGCQREALGEWSGARSVGQQTPGAPPLPGAHSHPQFIAQHSPPPPHPP